ncbi:MAG: hypothetical protein Q8L35_01700 [Actinomycetota bacterium]|nr:hypothetical protein [Actinomycetota bacterium]
MPADESGSTIVEYAIITAAMVLVLVAIVALAQPDLIGGWVEKTKRSFFVSGRLDNLGSIQRETQER